jgi:hypothetical protein
MSRKFRSDYRCRPGSSRAKCYFAAVARKNGIIGFAWISGGRKLREGRRTGAVRLYCPDIEDPIIVGILPI